MSCLLFVCLCLLLLYCCFFVLCLICCVLLCFIAVFPAPATQLRLCNTKYSNKRTTQQTSTQEQHRQQVGVLCWGRVLYLGGMCWVGCLLVVCCCRCFLLLSVWYGLLFVLYCFRCFVMGYYYYLLCSLSSLITFAFAMPKINKSNEQEEQYQIHQNKQHVGVLFGGGGVTFGEVCFDLFVFRCLFLLLLVSFVLFLLCCVFLFFFVVPPVLAYQFRLCNTKIKDKQHIEVVSWGRKVFWGGGMF